MMVEKPSKTFKRVIKQREKDFYPPFKPDKPFKRQYRKIKLSWPMSLIYNKRTDVLIVVLLVLGVLLVVAFFILYHIVFWIFDLLGWSF